jgi:hypothetical protein
MHYLALEGEGRAHDGLLLHNPLQRLQGVSVCVRVCVLFLARVQHKRLEVCHNPRHIPSTDVAQHSIKPARGWVVSVHACFMCSCVHVFTCSREKCHMRVSAHPLPHL